MVNRRSRYVNMEGKVRCMCVCVCVCVLRDFVCDLKEWTGLYRRVTELTKAGGGGWYYRRGVVVLWCGCRLSCRLSCRKRNEGFNRKEMFQLNRSIVRRMEV